MRARSTLDWSQCKIFLVSVCNLLLVFNALQCLLTQSILLITYLVISELVCQLNLLHFTKVNIANCSALTLVNCLCCFGSYFQQSACLKVLEMLWPSSLSTIFFKKSDKLQPHKYLQTLAIARLKLSIVLCQAAVKNNT